MKRQIYWLLCVIICMLFIPGCGKEKAKNNNIKTFSEYTDVVEYHQIPAFITENSKIGTVEDYGQSNYIMNIEGTTKKEYESYLLLMEDAGFEKYCDNGKDAMEGNVYSATFKKENLVVQVIYVVRLEKVMISASDNLALSEHLIYKDAYVKDNIAGAKTKIYFPKLNINNGFSAIIQLKNGNFLIHDGGGAKDGAELIQYLKKLTPNGKKPVVEAWFISHSHTDHVGAMQEIAIQESLCGSISVEEIYFMHPSQDDFAAAEDYAKIKLFSYALKAFRTANGKETPVYRPQFGQRYYFNDIVIDIAVTLEIEPYDTYEKVTYNDTSVYMMHYIEGQKYFTTGDGDQATMKTAMKVFPESYFEMDIYMVSHHGINVYNYFTDYCTIGTAIYTRNEKGSPAAVEENAYFLATVKEAYGRMDGDIVLTFPYVTGSAEIIKE